MLLRDANHVYGSFFLQFPVVARVVFTRLTFVVLITHSIHDPPCINPSTDGGKFTGLSQITARSLIVLPLVSSQRLHPSPHSYQD